MSDDVVKDAPTKKPKFIVRTMDDPGALCHVETWVSTQNVALDWALGGRGLPVRRIVEAYGDNSTGKSLLAAALCSEIQRMGGVASYADCEIAQYMGRLAALNIDPKTLLYSNPKTIDDVMEAMREHISWRNKKHGRNTPMVFAWDSLAAITTMAQIERAGKEGDENKSYPDVPRVLSQTLSREINTIAEENILLFVTNQTRQKLGMFVGDGATTTGGEAIKFYSSMRIELETRAKLKSGKDVIGANVQATVVKNRFAAPYKSVLMPVYYEYGMDEAEATFNVMVERAIVDHEKGSSWYNITLGGVASKFQKKDWTDLFMNNTEAIIALLNGGTNEHVS